MKLDGLRIIGKPVWLPLHFANAKTIECPAIPPEGLSLKEFTITHELPVMATDCDTGMQVDVGHVLRDPDVQWWLVCKGPLQHQEGPFTYSEAIRRIRALGEGVFVEGRRGGR